MRVRGTPASWSPSGPTIRYRTPPPLTGVVVCVVLALLAALVLVGVVHDEALTRFGEPSLPFGSRAPSSLWALLLGALTVGLASAGYVVRTLLFGHNGYLELDPGGRRLLRIGTTTDVLSFAEISVLTRRRYDITTVYAYRTDRNAQEAIARGRRTSQRAVMQLVAMPSGVVLHASDASLPEFEHVVHTIAATIGAPVV